MKHSKPLCYIKGSEGSSFICLIVDPSFSASQMCCIFPSCVLFIKNVSDPRCVYMKWCCIKKCKESTEIEITVKINTPDLVQNRLYNFYVFYFVIHFHKFFWTSEINFFTITAEFLARSLASFYQYADRHINLKFVRHVSERERAIRPFVIVKNKLMSVFLWVCPVLDHKFRHRIVKVVCGSTRLSLRGSTATLTM